MVAKEISMNLFTKWIAGAVIAALAITAHAGTTPSPAEQEVVAAIHARIDAFNHRDIAAFNAAAARPYLGVGDDQASQESVPDYWRLPREFSQINDIRDLHVRVHGDTAVANYRTTEHEPMGGIDLVTEERRSEAWQKQRGRWRLLQAHLAAIPVNFRQPVAGEPAHLADYPGAYEARSDNVATVTVAGGHLYIVFTGEPAPWKASYGGGDVFFFRQMQGDPVTYEFERDAANRVVALLMRRPDGQTMRATRR
jgi:ketosteroid isomerase-like protein